MAARTRPSGEIGTGAAATKEKLLLAARACLLRKGYAATSIKDIAAESGMNHALVHHHFGSKEGLYHALLFFDAELTDRAIRSHADRDGQWAAFERSFIHNSRLMLEFHAMAHEMPSIRKALKSMLHDAVLKTRTDLGLKDNDEAQVVLAALAGLALLYNADKKVPVQRIVGRLLEAFAPAGAGGRTPPATTKKGGRPRAQE